jgi:hypothetical protein
LIWGKGITGPREPLGGNASTVVNIRAVLDNRSAIIAAQTLKARMAVQSATATSRLAMSLLHTYGSRRI